MRRGHKYRARPTNGYASKLEHDYAVELRTLEMGGAITDLVEQVRVPLVAGIVFVADFAYTEPGGRRVWADTKGIETPVFRLKARLWKYCGPGPLKVIKRTRGRFVVDRTIVPEG